MLLHLSERIESFHSIIKDYFVVSSYWDMNDRVEFLQRIHYLLLLYIKKRCKVEWEIGG